MTEIRSGYKPPTAASVLFRNTVDILEKNEIKIKTIGRSILQSNVTNSAATTAIGSAGPMV